MSQTPRRPANGTENDGSVASDPRNGVGTAQAGMSRAEKFEDEKRRFIESCFSKKDNDGSIIESYITHIRITEDAAHPTAPPPPNSIPDNKKPRLIVVAVRKSGRVRMHKARENANGSFSIGKTWVLDDLTAIQSYSALVPANQLEQQHKEWASSVGFLVMIGKPYYWQAATAKEKDFFIASLVKIFKKYTGGKTPELNGFTKEEREALVGGALPQAQPQGRGPPARPERPDKSELSAPPRPSSAQGRPPIISSRNRGPSRDPSRERGPGSNPYAARPPSREAARESGSQAGYYNRAPSREGNYEQQPPQVPYYNRAPSREGSREPRQKPSEELFLRKKASREQMQRIPGQYPSGRPQQDLTPQSSHSQLSRDQTSSPSNFRNLPNGFSPTPPPAPQSDSSARNLGNAPSIESFDTAGSKQSKTIPRETNQFPANKPIMNLERKDSPYQRPESPQTEDRNIPTKSSTQPGPDINQEQVPERRRPPFQGPNLSFGQRSMRKDSNEKFSTPMGTPGIQDTEGRAPSRGSDRATPSVPTSKATSYFTAPIQKETPGANAVTPKASVIPSEPPQTNGDPDSLVAVHDALSAPTPFSEELTPTAEQKEEEAFRPGLGPMMKKKSSKDVAKTFRKAATAYGAFNTFKPRAGGAGEKFLAEKEKMTTEPDGITGVVPAPLQRGAASDGSRSGTPDLKDRPLSPSVRERPFSPMGIAFKQETPKVQITRTATDEIQSTGKSREAESAESPEHSRSISPGQAETRRKRKSDNSAKYLNALGIDPVILEGRGSDFDSVLTELGWNGRLSDDKKVEELEADVRREIGRVQAGSWLGHMEQQEVKIDQLSKMFDRCAEECEELDGLLTLYAHELNTLNDDIAYIEAQSQGLQVQTANQKLLQTELQNLLGTLNVSSSQLQPLKEASLSTADGVERIENSLSTLYQAMVTIDPSIRHDRNRQLADDKEGKGRLGATPDKEVSGMRAVREKKDVYQNESLLFVQRLRQHMSKGFKNAARRTVESIERSHKQLRLRNYKLDPTIHDGTRQEIWMYSPLMLFTRDVDTSEWEGMMRSYEQSIKVAYQDEFRDAIAAWTKSAKKSTGEEQDLLFTGQEKEQEREGLTTAARKLTVKRGKTVRVAGTLRSSVEDKQDGKMEPFEAFSGALGELTTLIFEEQNFVTQFFHATSHSNTGFTDAVASTRPQYRTLPKLSSKQPFDPDREMAKRVSQLMEDVFPSWTADVQNMVDWALKPDQLQTVGLLYTIERRQADLEETNQEFLLRTLQRVHISLGTSFTKFVVEQIRGIEETKVKIKKRKGVIAFMKTFPHFSMAIENMLPNPEPSSETMEVRYMINDAYTKINRAMWESLNFIAKESPGGGQTSGSGDPEDKEALNYHILLIENMNHYVEEVEARNNIVLEEWRDKAAHDMGEHLKLYLDAVIRRPLGKLLDFIESVESLLSTVNPPSSIATRASHSRSTAKKVFSAYDSKEIRRGIETLKKRVEKHFGDADDPGLSRSLVGKVLRELESRYGLVWERATRISEIVYENSLEVEWKREELATAFRR